MKKKHFLTLTLCLTFAFANAQDDLTVSAKIKGLEPGLTVYYSPLDQEMPDSVITRKDGFVIKHSIPQGAGNIYLIRIGKKYQSNNVLLVYLEKGNVKITGKGPMFQDAKLSGAKFIEDYNEFNKLMNENPQLKEKKELYAKANELYSKDSAAYAALKPELARLDSITTVLTTQWILNHPASPISAFLLQFNLGRSLDIDEQEKILNQLSPAARDNVPGKKLEHSIRVNKLTGIGKPAPVFTQNDTLGKPVSLTDFRGKYVLIDFWASWCVPCREENPAVVAAFKNYKNKGFTVLGVSFDQPNGKEKWLKAIHDDGLAWNHVSDLKYWKNEVGQLYDIHSIPANFLVDPNGIIVAKDLHGEELQHKLKEILGSPEKDPAGPYSLKGQIKGAKDGWIYLYVMGSDEHPRKDSARIQGGSFLFKGEVPYPQQATLSLPSAGNNRRESYFSVFLESSDILVEADAADLEKAVITGSATQKEYDDLQLRFVDIEKRAAPLRAEFEKANEVYVAAMRAKKSEKELDALHEKANAAREKLDPFSDERRVITLQYFRDYPQSYVTASNIRYYVSSLSLDSAEAMYARMGEKIQQTSYGKELDEEIQKLKSGSPGSMAKNFSGQDINGKPLSLTDLRGKYVLLDFWASWCVPCRKGNPHLLGLYAKYKSKGLEIVGVSDDDSNPAAWKAAVAKDKIGVWKHVLRGLKRTPEGYDKSEDKSEWYGIHTLPTKILIDPQGKIIGRYTGGSEDDAAMDRKLAEVFQ